MDKPIAVIILNWNGEKLMREFLPSVCANTNSRIADIIVADNGSTDDSVEMLKKEFPSVELIEFDKNYGFAEGYNRAVEATRYKYTVLLNSDVETPSKWLEPLYDYCESHPTTAVCQPKIMSLQQRDKFEYAGAAGGFIDRLGYPYCRGRIFGSIEKDRGQYDGEPCEIMWASGAAFFVSTEAYMRAGGLDATFFAHMEEIDLCWRIHQMGYSIKAITQSAVYHLGGGSLPASDPRKTYLNFRNNLLLLYKNTPQKEGRKLLLRRRLYDTIAFAKFAVTLSWGNARAILKAHADFKKMRGSYTTFPQKNVLALLPGSNRNIIYDYYVKGRHTYGNL